MAKSHSPNMKPQKKKPVLHDGNMGYPEEKPQKAGNNMTIAAETLTEGQTILVQGKLSFSRLARLIEGAELEKRIASSKGFYPTKVPHTTISLIDARVVPADPNNVTTEEQFVQEKMYQVKSGDNAGKTGYNIDDKSGYLPPVFGPSAENAGAYTQVILESDLASGLDVTLVLNTFKPAGYAKRGIGLQQVLVNEPVRYYSQGANTQDLAARGIVIDGPIKRVAGNDSTAAAPAPEEHGADTAADAYGNPAPAPMTSAPAPVQAPAPQAAPVAAVSQAQATGQPQAAPEESPAEELARLRAESAANKGNSAFTQPAANAATEDPWQTPNEGITYGGAQ